MNMSARFTVNSAEIIGQTIRVMLYV